MRNVNLNYIVYLVKIGYTRYIRNIMILRLITDGCMQLS